MEFVVGARAPTQKDQNLWPRQFNMTTNEGQTGGGLRRRRTSVPGWPPEENIRDVNRTPFPSERRQHSIQQLAARAQKRQTLTIFIDAWRLTHEHQIGARLTVREHRIRRGEFQSASLEALKPGAQIFDALCAAGNGDRIASTL